MGIKIGVETLRTQDTSAPSDWCGSVQTVSSAEVSYGLNVDYLVKMIRELLM